MITLISKLQKPAHAFGLALCLVLCANTARAKVDLVPKWGRFERSFKSSAKYENPIQQCTLQISFVSPRGETNQVEGFWDGGKTWRVRFSPDQPGRWTYRTSCSDTANDGLNNQTGEFLCTSPLGEARFERHGPVQIARDHRHFEHADGSPFFWMADMAWNAPGLSSPRDWITYTQVRSGQKFSAVEWAVAPGMDAKKHSAFSGRDRIAIDPEYFQRLDEKVEMMNRAGLLSVIAPSWGDDPAFADLPDDQAALLVRYLNARWGAYDVAWLLAVNEARSARWIKIGRAAFADAPHAPVIVFPGEMSSGFGEFRHEKWVDAFGFGLGQNLDNDSLKWLIAGPVSSESLVQPPHPLINVLPPLENGLSASGGNRIAVGDVRRMAWSSLLLTRPAGVSYGAQDVANWNTAVQAKLPTWRLSLFLPGAKEMSHVEEFFASEKWWTLHPSPHSLAMQPGRGSPRRYITASESDTKDLTLAYVPEDRTVEVYLTALPPSPAIQWLNPHTGQKSPAVAVVGATTCQLPTPDPGDWVLVMKSGK